MFSLGVRAAHAGRTASLILVPLAVALAAPCAAAATHVGGLITANTTWTLAGSPYVIDSGVTVGGGVTLTVEPGVVVKGGADDRWIQVYGTLSAEGTGAAPIHFTSLADDSVGGDTNGDGTASAPARGDWGGIGFRAGSTGNALTYAVVRYAGHIDWGYYHYAGIYTEVSALALSHVTVSDNAEQGLRATTAAAPSVADSSFVRNAAWAIYCDAVNCTTAALRRNAASENGANGIRVAGTLGAAATWEDAIPFVLDGAVSVAGGVVLTLAPSVVVKAISPSSYLVVYGALHADATGHAPIRFTSLRDDTAGGDTNGDGATSTPARGDWGGIGFLAGSTASVLANASVRYAGGVDWGYYHNAAIYTQVSELILDRVTIDASLQEGLSAAGSAAPAVTNCAFTNNARWAVLFDDPDGTRGGMRGNSATGNGVNGISVNGTLEGSAMWEDDIPFVLNTTVAVAAGATLTVAPGRVIKASPGITRLLVYGTLNAQGTAEATIHLTSLRDDSVGGDTNGDGSATSAAAGDWQGLGIMAGSTANRIAHAVVRYGGNTDWGYYHNATLWVETSDLVVTATTVSNSFAHGLGTRDTAAPQVTGCAFADNAGDGARLGAGVVTLGGSTFTGNGGWALYCEAANASRALSGNTGSGNRFNAIRVAGNLDGSATWENSLPFVLDPLVNVMPGTTLTILPGAVVKAAGASGRLAVYGTLRADGTGGAPVTFTAFADDAAGGDSNGDGTATAPAPGAWGGIGFLPGSTANTVSYAAIRYGGGLDWGFYHYGNIYCDTSSLAVSHSTLALSLTEGLRTNGAAAPTFDGVTFAANAGWAGYFDDPDGTTGTLRSTVMTGNGMNGWRVGGTLDGTATWDDDVPFVVDGVLGVGAAARLDIKDGSVVKIATAGTGRIQVVGALRAEGTEALPVTFTSLRDDTAGGDTNGDGTATAPAPGDIAGLGFYASSTNSVLVHTVVRYGGGMDWGFYHNANVYSESAGLSITDSTIADGQYAGIYFPSGTVSIARTRIERCGGFGLQFGATPTGAVDDCPAIESVYYEPGGARVAWAGNSFPNWGLRTSRALAGEVASLTSGGNTFYGVSGAVLEVGSGYVTRDGTWSDAAGPLVALGNLIVQGTDGPDARTTLTLGPGVTLRFADSAGLYVGDGGAQPGELVADGRLPGGGARTVVLTSASGMPAVGSWSGVDIRTNGRFSVHELQVLWANVALTARGPFGAVDGFSVKRANTGMYLLGIGAGQELDRLVFENCDIGFRASNAPVTLRYSELIGRSWGAYNDTPGAVVDARQNWWGATSGPSGQGPGSGSRVGTGILFDPWLDRPEDDGDGVPLDSGHGFPFPCTCGQTTDCDDNCALVANPSQKDADCDGVGDACDTNPVLTVSNDPADLADFATIQDAVDATFESGSNIEIFPGLHPYYESVRIDRYQVYSFAGRDTEGHAPVIVDGSGAPAFYVQNKVGASPLRFRQLTLRGATGVQAAVGIDAEQLTFDSITGRALDLSAGAHRVTRCAVLPGAAVGAAVGSGAELTLSRTTVRGCSDAGLLVAGTATIENSVVAGGNAGADGVRLATGANATLRYATVADNTGAGIDNAAGGTVAVETSILWHNTLGDLVNVACTAVGWSDVGVPDCSAVNANLRLDPLLELDDTLRDGSPCLDHGPSPAAYDGRPPTDLAGGPRLIDFDGNGLAENDCGAFEKAAPVHVPGEVRNVVFATEFTLAWESEPAALVYNVYRGDLAQLGYSYFGTCRNDLDTNRADLQLIDHEAPATAQAFFYLITAQAAGGAEGTLGSGTSAERSNYARCP